MQALVVTDTSERFSDWPKSDGNKASNKFQPIDRKEPSELSRRDPDRKNYSAPSDGKQPADVEPPTRQIPLLARRAAARRQAAGLPARNTAPVYTGPLPNNRSDIDAESVSLAATMESQSMRGRGTVSFAEQLQPQRVPASSSSSSGERERRGDFESARGGSEGGRASYSHTHEERGPVKPSPAEMLARAQGLLMRVKGSVSENRKRAEQKAEERAVDREGVVLGQEVVDSINDWASALTRSHAGPGGGRASSGGGVSGGRKWPGQPPSISPSKVNEVEWLLRGVPEVFEDDAYIEDEVVEKLIQEGGLPPSQLAFPSLYEASQRTLSGLRDIKKMQLTITGLMVASSRCGLRRHGSYMVIHCPSGCKGAVAGASDSRSITVEIPDPHANRGPDVGKHKNVMKDYFVGSVPLDIRIDWNVLLTDGVLRDWLHPSTSRVNGVLHIEFYSYLSPPLKPDPLSNRSRSGRASRGLPEDKRASPLQPVWSAPALLLGFADVPLDNLLSTTALRVHVTSDIVMDKASQATIADRLERLPTGVSLRTAKPLGDSLGNVMCTLALLNEDGDSIVSDEKGRGSVPARESEAGVTMITHKTRAETSSVGISHEISHHTKLRTVIDDALDFAPADTFAPHHQSYALPGGVLAQSPGQGNDSTPAYIGIALHFVTLALDEAALAQLRLPIRNEPVKIVLSYKIALSNGSIRDEADAVIPAYKFTSSAPCEVELSTGRIHSIEDMMTWRFVYFEVWVRWRGVVHPQTDESKFLGLAKFPVHTNIGEPVALPIIDPSTGRSYGHIDTTVQFHHRGTSDEAEKLLEKCLTSESVRRMLRTNHVRSVGSKPHSATEKSSKPSSQHTSNGRIDSSAGSKSAGFVSSHVSQSVESAARSARRMEGQDNLQSPPGSPVKSPRQADIALEPVAAPKLSAEPDMTFSLRASAQKSIDGTITSFNGSLRFSGDSLMGGLFRASSAAERTREDVANSIDSLELASSRYTGVVGEGPGIPGADVTEVEEAYNDEEDGEDGEVKEEVAPQKSTALAEHPHPSKHILDLSVLGSFSEVWEQYSRRTHYSGETPLGCFVCYRFPKLASNEVESWVGVL
jgi:hypothetical protein